ncbi:MAG: YHS domain-containing protein [Betaproteobacteria bacterium]|nr:YHS domain-containing protein [Betaproteobacteria bacterium]
MDKRVLRDAPFLISMAVLLALASTIVLAGEFNEVDGVAIRGYDPVAYVTENRAERGSQSFAGAYKGSTFHFKSAANRDLFLANPEKYAPQYSGYCAFGVSRGYKAGISPEAFSVIEGKLYLNYNSEVKATWTKDVPGYVARADEKWPAVEKTTKVIR